MKKGLLLSVVLLLVVVITGCGKAGTKTMKCTMKGTILEGTTMKNEYKVTYTGKYVDMVESIETVTSDSQKVLDTYKTTIESMYSPYKDVKYYDYDITIEGDTLTSVAKINYAKIDTDAMIKVNSANKSLLKDGKLALKDLKDVYEQMGAECK